MQQSADMASMAAQTRVRSRSNSTQAANVNRRLVHSKANLDWKYASAMHAMESQTRWPGHQAMFVKLLCLRRMLWQHCWRSQLCTGQSEW
jgi:hypothetical protein